MQCDRVDKKPAPSLSKLALILFKYLHRRIPSHTTLITEAVQLPVFLDNFHR